MLLTSSMDALSCISSNIIIFVCIVSERMNMKIHICMCLCMIMAILISGPPRSTVSLSMRIGTSITVRICTPMFIVIGYNLFLQLFYLYTYRL